MADSMRRISLLILSLVAIAGSTVALFLTSAQARVTTSGQSHPLTGQSHLLIQQAHPLARAAWRRQIQQLALPGRGCFAGAYPALKWHRIACVAEPKVKFAPSAAPTPAAPVASTPETVGGTQDYAAQASSGSISSATGTIPYVSPGASETGMDYIYRKVKPNTFTLQLNTNQISGSPACAQSQSASVCRVWEQFVYSSSTGAVFIQYWLIDYSWSATQSYSASDALRCPSGWIKSVLNSTSGNWYVEDCYRSTTAAVLLRPLPTVATLSKVSLNGSAAANGNDSLVMSYGPGRVIAISAADSVLSIGGRWSAAEFAIVGDGDGTVADFSSGTVLDVKTSINDGASAAPVCLAQGFTAETSNLSFASAPSLAPSGEPAIETQQSTGGRSASCATAAQSPVTINDPGTQTPTVGGAVSLQMQGSDGSNAQNLTWTAANLPAGLSISASGLITGKPKVTQDINSTITATDPTGANATVSFLWRVHAKLAAHKLRLAVTIKGRNLLLKITPGTGAHKRLQCSLVRLRSGRPAGRDVWSTCWPGTEYKNLPPGRYRLRVRGTGGEVTRYITIR